MIMYCSYFAGHAKWRFISQNEYLSKPVAGWIKSEFITDRSTNSVSAHDRREGRKSITIDVLPYVSAPEEKISVSDSEWQQIQM